MAGRSKAARIIRIVIVTKSSMSVKPVPFRSVVARFTEKVNIYR